MRRGPFFLIAAVLSAPAPALAQNVGSAEDFASVPWGSTEDAILAEWGEPTGRGEEDLGGDTPFVFETLLFEGQSLGGADSAVMLFAVSPEYGLLMGSYSLHDPDDAVTQAAFSEWQVFIESTHGRELLSCAPCDDWDRAVIWSTSGSMLSGARFFLTLTADTVAIRVLSPHFDDALREHAVRVAQAGPRRSAPTREKETLPEGGFASIRWESSEEEVVERWGTPLQRIINTPVVVSLSYEAPNLVGVANVTMTFFVVRGLGLFAGTYGTTTPAFSAWSDLAEAEYGGAVSSCEPCDSEQHLANYDPKPDRWSAWSTDGTPFSGTRLFLSQTADTVKLEVLSPRWEDAFAVIMGDQSEASQ